MFPDRRHLTVVSRKSRKTYGLMKRQLEVGRLLPTGGSAKRSGPPLAWYLAAESNPPVTFNSDVGRAFLLLVAQG
jgi:hypothetical protein